MCLLFVIHLLRLQSNELKQSLLIHHTGRSSYLKKTLKTIDGFYRLCWQNRELKKPRRRRRGQRGLKNEFIFYFRISRYPKVIDLVYLCQGYRETESGTYR